MKHTVLVAKSMLALATLALLASCKDQSNPYGSTTTTVPPPAPNTVYMANMAYSPSSITVTHGTAVTWKNIDSYATHTATSDSASWDTGNITSGASKSVTFAVPGTYTYHCTYHGSMGMTGRVVVQ